MAQLYYSPSFSLPSSVTDQLTWNGTAQASVTFNTSGDSFSDLLVMDLQSTAAVTASGAYPWSIDQPDQLFARQDAAVQYWYLIDYQGSVRDVLDNSGNVNDAITYDGFGNIISETNSTYRGRYAWTGRVLDVEMGLQYNRARWYDPTTGQWQSEDPLGFEAGDSNLYRYVYNAPTNHTDASGLSRMDMQQLPDGTAALYYIGTTCGFFDAAPIYIGNWDPINNMVVRSVNGENLWVPIEEVRGAANAWGLRHPTGTRFFGIMLKK